MLFALFLAVCSSLQAQTAQVSLLGPAQARLGSETQYRALINGAIATEVVWSVNGVVGGSSSTGLISASGVYSPAGTVSASRSVTISATTELKPASSASMTVRILNPLPSLTSGSVTQTAPGVNFSLDMHGAGFVSASRLLVSGAEVPTIFVSVTELRSTIVLPQGTTTVNVGVVNPHAAQRTPANLTLPVQAAVSAAALSGFTCSSASMKGSGSNACTVTLNAAAPSGGLSVSLASSNAAVVVPGTTLVPANAMSATFMASVSPVTSAQSVMLTATGGSVARTFSLQLTASVPTLAISPGSVTFGNLALNTPSTEPVTLTSTGTAPVTINSGRLSGTGFTMSGATFPISLNPGLALTLDVQFNPTTAGPATGQLTIASDSSINPTAVISLSGTGTSVIGVSMSPATATVTSGSAQQFAASVTGTTNTGVTWTVSGAGCTGAACGTISANGLYTAPEVVPVPATVTVTGSSEADDTKSDTSVVTIEKNNGATYYLAAAAEGGSDSNSGLSASLPWLSPNHSLNCGDTIIAAPSTAYSQNNFSAGRWGTVTCSPGSVANVAWLKCATFDGCKLTATNQDAMWVTASYWGVQGWEVTATGGQAICFASFPPTSTANLHHIIFANDIANGCYGAGFQPVPNGKAGTDYFVLIGNIAYNATQQNNQCGSGISIFEPAQTDTLPGTHIYVAGNYTWDNVDGNPCAGGTPTDGEGIIFDTFDGNNYTQQAVMENNVSFMNGSSGFRVDLTTKAPIYIVNNTSYGNNFDKALNSSWCGEIALQQSTGVHVSNNIARATSATGCGSNANYALYVADGNSTDVMTTNFAYGMSGQNTGQNGSTGFSFAAGNILGVDPQFANPPASNPGPPNCAGTGSVAQCMSSTFAGLLPKATSAAGLGVRPLGGAATSDPLFPGWLCNVALPADLLPNHCP